MHCSSPHGDCRWRSAAVPQGNTGQCSAGFLGYGFRSNHTAIAARVMHRAIMALSAMVFVYLPRTHAISAHVGNMSGRVNGGWQLSIRQSRAEVRTLKLFDYIALVPHLPHVDLRLAHFQESGKNQFL